MITTLTNMKTFEEIQKGLQQEIEMAAKKKQLRQIKAIGLQASQFAILIKQFCDLALINRNEETEFVVTDQNREILNQLYYYLVQDPKFKGDFNKGILLAGTFGVGKTLIMHGFLDVVSLTAGKKVSRFHSKDVAHEIGQDESFIKAWSNKPMFIDDIGKESRLIKNYGTELHPVADLFSMRYDTGAITFATANHKLESFKDIYGGSIHDRMRQMFNILFLTGKSLR